MMMEGSVFALCVQGRIFAYQRGQQIQASQPPETFYYIKHGHVVPVLGLGDGEHRHAAGLCKRLLGHILRQPQIPEPFAQKLEELLIVVQVDVFHNYLGISKVLGKYMAFI